MNAENPFGPFYPPRLQGPVNHAERLAEAIAKRAAGAQAAPWLVNRSDEIACVVAQVVREWRSAEIDEGTAARALAEYLDVLHEGFVATVGGAPPPCCAAEALTTTSPATEVTVPPAMDPDAFAATTTIDVDTGDLLAGLEAPEARR